MNRFTSSLFRCRRAETQRMPVIRKAADTGCRIPPCSVCAPGRRIAKRALPRKYVSSWLRCRGCGNYRYLNTEALQSANQRPLELLGVTSVEVLCSEIAIGLLSLEHVEHD